MNNSIRIIAAIFLASIYGFAALNASYSVANFDSVSHQTNEQEKYSEISSKSFFCHTPPSEIAISNVNNASDSNLKNQFDKFWSLPPFNEQSVQAIFSQYCNSFNDFLIHCRKADLIFPFHYFW